MESYLQNHPGVRWSIIFVLLFCIIVQLVLVRNKLASETVMTTPFINQASPTKTLSISKGNPVMPTPTATNNPLPCQVRINSGIDVRSQPTTEFGEIINILPFNSRFEPLGRSRDMAWLLVRVEDKLGWISAEQVSKEIDVTCQNELLNLPEIDSASDLERFIATASPEPTATVSLTPKSTPNLVLTPSVSEVELTVSPKGTQSPTNTPTITATLSPTATPRRLMRQNNGPDMHAPKRTFAINLDGNLSEWNNVPRVNITHIVHQPHNWQGTDDLSGFTLATWDNQNLYLAAQVTDDKIIQRNWGEQLVFGDGIELYWDSDLEGDFNIDGYNDDDSQIVFSPTSGNNFPAFWVHFSPNTADIQIASTFTEVGYNVEVRIPWSLLGVVPTENAIFGVAVTIIDNDTEGTSQQETMISTTPRAPYTHPTYWGNFILDP